MTELASANPYAQVLDSLTQLFGEPEFDMTILGPPRGFTVARKRERSPGTQRAYLWAGEVRAMLDHVYGVDHLKSTETEPLFFWTEAWFGSRRHCDPENTHKLLKDSLFYLDRGLKDKYTGGVFAGPLYDLSAPRTVVKIWRLSVLPHSGDAVEAKLPEAEDVTVPPRPKAAGNPFGGGS